MIVASRSAAYPGQGAPGDLRELIEQQREYLVHFRGLVAEAIAPGSAAGEAVAPEEEAAIVADMDARYLDYPSVASIPDMPERNIAAVSAEMTAEDPRDPPRRMRGRPAVMRGEGVLTRHHGQVATGERGDSA